MEWGKIKDLASSVCQALTFSTGLGGVIKFVILVTQINDPRFAC